MKISRTVSYALQAALQLAESRRDTPTPCSQLAARGKMPERFLLQILRNMVAHGILISTRGVEGGYALQRPPEDITLLHVIEAIDGPLTTVIPAGEGLPDPIRKRLEVVLCSATTSAREHLERVSLADLLRNGQTSAEPERSAAAEAVLPEGKTVVVGGELLARNPVPAPKFAEQQPAVKRQGR